MPYDPNFPATDTLAAATPMRAQFQAVIDLIQSIPAGPQGPPGADESPGPQGDQGTAGPQGATGAPGEVSNAQLQSAITGTSSNSNAVSLLNLSVSDPPTQAEVQALANKLDELIQALRRG